MTNKAKGELSFEANGERYTLAYSVNALCDLEGEFDDMPAAVAGLLRPGGKRRLTTLRTVFRAGLAEHHGAVMIHEAGKLMTAVGIERAFALVAEGIMLAFPPGEEGGSTGGTPLPKDASDGTGKASSPAG